MTIGFKTHKISLKADWTLANKMTLHLTYKVPHKAKNFFLKLCAKLFNTRLLGVHLQFLTVALSVCEHLLFVQYKTKTKKFANFIIFCRAFSNFYKNKKLLNTNLKILIFINLPWGHLRSHNKQTPKLNLNIEVN